MLVFNEATGGLVKQHYTPESPPCTDLHSVDLFNGKIYIIGNCGATAKLLSIFDINADSYDKHYYFNKDSQPFSVTNDGSNLIFAGHQSSKASTYFLKTTPISLPFIERLTPLSIFSSVPSITMGDVTPTPTYTQDMYPDSPATVTVSDISWNSPEVTDIYYQTEDETIAIISGTSFSVEVDLV